MMSDDDPTEPADDPKISRGRHQCLVLGLLFVAACAIAAIVLPLVLDDDCDCTIKDLRGGSTDAPTRAPTPIDPPSPTTSPVDPTPAPTPGPEATAAPTTQRFKQFVEVFLYPISGEEAFEDPNSPQYRAAEFLALVDTVAPELGSAAPVGDRYALATFYYAMDGDDSWFNCYDGHEECPTGNSWMDPEVNHCEWYSVRCNEEGRVVDLFFATTEGNGLVGSIPHEIFLLTELENLVAVNNLIGGNFPESFGQMTNLTRIVLTTNVMSGVIPEGFLANAPLELFMVANNEFSGPIPASFGSIPTLTQLVLSNNEFSGTIPEELAALELLGTLDLSDCDRLRGIIPEAIFGMSNLENLALDGCSNVEGVLTDSIAGLSGIVTLKLGGTGIGGPLPEEIFTFSNIEEIDLANAEFTGALSESFANLAGSLRILRLSNNDFSGDVPDAFDSLVLLNILELEGNDLTGEISDAVCDRRGEDRTDLNELTVDCAEVECDCCSNCGVSL